MSEYLWMRAEINARWAKLANQQMQKVMTRIMTITADLPADRHSKPTPWCVDDLRRKTTKGYTSVYRGVVKATFKPGWQAYRPQTSRKHRRALGWFADELDAARAVLYALNPAAAPEITPTPTETTSDGSEVL